MRSRRQADGTFNSRIKAQNIDPRGLLLQRPSGGIVEVKQDGDLPTFQVKLGTKVELRGYLQVTRVTGEERCVAACKQQAAG